MWHPEAKLGVGDAQYPWPCGFSSSCPWSQSFHRHPRSLSRHRLERRVTFWEPEVELDPSERPYRGPQGHSFGIHLEDSNGVSPFTQRQGTVCTLKMPLAYPDLEVGGDYPPEPSIRNIEVWLDWQAHQLECHTGGWNSLPFLMWRPQRDYPRKSTPLSWSQQLDVRLSRPRVHCTPYPQMSHQEYVSPWWSVLSGCLTAALDADCGLCPGATVLGREI